VRDREASTESEPDLVALARALIAAQPAAVWALLYGKHALAPAISTTCARLLGDALAQVWPALWRRGGSEPGASIEGGAVRRGRIWERHAPVGLTFSVATLRLLRWLVATPLTGPAAGLATLDAAPLTVGDQLMIYFALEATAGTTAQPAIAAQPLVRAAPLAWLGFIDRCSSGGAAPPPFAGLCHGAGAIVVEALSRDLARRWRAVELSKRAIAAPQGLIELGGAQDATLDAFMAACDQHRRRDLAGFVIDAAAPLLRQGIAPVPGRLDPTIPLGTRAAARRAAGALLRGVTRWAAWDDAHRGVRFIDDDYAAAQLLLARFEAIGPAGTARAASWLSELAQLAPTPSGSAATVEAS